ncbi:PDZ domain-containing protein [Dyadobacter tibetensis]|uniref:PDZ domain-containing protein n=1 Tax=Dyadobacter tibetensis TaxID=1211851 RepID=UPI000472BE3F|nr:PDZ domain-containing protein [Dyadobacter tibetensis]
MIQFIYKIRSTALISVLLLIARPVVSLDLYVSLKGDDRNPGTMQKPLATLQGAQLKIRTIQVPVTVYVRAGTYYLSKPILFGPEDSREPKQRTIFKPYANEHVVISGGVPISLQWKRHRDNILKAQVPQELLFDQIYLDGQKQRMARFPNFDPAASHFGGYSEEVLSPERIKKWKNPTGAFIHALHSHEWGGYHYRVIGKKSEGELDLEGGYQNNRQMGMHKKYRFIENIFEELDTLHEWYFDKGAQTLYLYGSDIQAISKQKLVTPQLKSLIMFRGTANTPVRNIHIEGFEFAHVLRSFMDTKEPLLRSDWAIYRGGTVLLEGTENCSVKKCYFNEVGGNGVFFSNYNRSGEVSGCHIKNAGASGICFVGDPAAVRSPSFEYHQSIPYKEMDLKPGPVNNNYPAECKVYDNLIHDIGTVEKQVAGVHISMSMDIEVSHNTIYNVPRSGINISEGTWGGHLIEFNDVFNTVLETGDHGAFNSWGRDRFWHPNRKVMDSLVASHPELILLDVQKTIVLRNNRFRCDHGWDIDLDDGSSNYYIYNNLCLNGGLKLREGFNRKVENNIMVNNSFHPHVWFANSKDIFRHNIVTKPYFPIRVNYWGQEVNYNFFPDQKSLEASQKNGTDQNSKSGNPEFMDPKTGDYRVEKNSAAKKIGFKNFPMDQFGVVSAHLKSLAIPVPLPLLHDRDPEQVLSEAFWLGGKIRNVSGLGDRSAFGLPDQFGVIVEELVSGSVLSKSPLQKGDVIRKIEGISTPDVSELMNEYQKLTWKGRAQIEVYRNQRPIQLDILFK